jgi:hypothetical protein
MAGRKVTAAQVEPASDAELEFARQLVEKARSEGLSLVGPGGLLAGITRTVLESALDAEMDEHLDDPDGVSPASGRRVNIRNGHGGKTVQTDVGPVRIQVPRDRAGTFEGPGSGPDPALAENVIRRGQATCRYSWRIPPKRALLR